MRHRQWFASIDHSGASHRERDRRGDRDMTQVTELTKCCWPADTSSPLAETTVGGVLRAAAEAAPDEVARVAGMGELCARGYLVMHGYHRRHARRHRRGRWYHTGDLASMDEHGYLRIEGRITDMIIRGGENIYPREIEDVLSAHPAVAEAAVVGIPDDRRGEVVAASVRPTSAATAPTPDLRTHCRERSAPYKTPVHWRFVDSFPLTGSGKIQKFKLREGFVA
jgi:fatty-acyl-CoA synthase